MSEDLAVFEREVKLDPAPAAAWLASNDDDEADEDEDPDADSADFVVWPENWAAVELFRRLDTQWLWQMSACIGLNYVAVESVMRMCGITRRNQGDLLDALRIMEVAALPLINRTRD